ncbi:hypothetical protein D9M73_213780 [compost metagenome]
MDIEKRPRWQHIGLPVGRRQPLVIGQILAMHGELRRRAAAIGVLHHHDIGQAFAVAAVHLVHERGKPGLAHLPLALVDVVDHVFAEQGEEARHVTRVEGGVVSIYQFGSGHGTIPVV